MEKRMIRWTAAALALCLTLGMAGCNRDGEEKEEPKEEPEDKPGVVETLPDADASGGIQTAGYWLAKLGESTVTSPDYKGYNASLAAAGESTNCVDLAAMGDTIGGDELRAMLDAIATPQDERYIGASKATADYYARLTANLNRDAVAESNAVGYGFAADNTLLRTFPTADPSYEMENDEEFDLFNETMLKIFEPVRILHTSADGNWRYVQAWNYRGWASAADIAETDSAEWARYADPEQVLVVTGNRVTLNENVYNDTASGRELFMGTALPLLGEAETPATIDFMTAESGHAVLLPKRGGDGRLTVVQALVPWNADVHVGYLPYSPANVLREAMKLAGDRHGWSGMNKSRDSSAIVADVYSTFGFRLPRNSSQQAAMPGESVDLSGMTDGEKASSILAQAPGSVVVMDGHVALYLGEEGGAPYVLHSIYVAYDEAGAEEIVNAIVATDLSLLDKDGNTYLSDVKSVKQIA